MLGVVHRYDTVSEFLDSFNREAYDGTYSWMGNMDATEALACAVYGHNDAVGEAEKVITRLESSLQMPETAAWETVRSPFIGRVDIADWCAGSPTPMRRRVKRIKDTAPIKIVVDTFVSQGVDSDVLKRRGAAIVALVMLVQRFKPVDLFACSSSTHTEREGYRHFVIRLESRPVSLSQIGFVLGHPAFSRSLSNGFFTVMNPKAPSVPCLRLSREEIRANLGLTARDIYIDRALYSDPMVSDTDAWIRNQLDLIIRDANG